MGDGVRKFVCTERMFGKIFLEKFFKFCLTIVGNVCYGVFGFRLGLSLMFNNKQERCVMAKRQILRNSISYEDGMYYLTYFAKIDGTEKKLATFESQILSEIICARELLANLPTLESKLQALENFDEWFNKQMEKIHEKATSINKKPTRKTEKEKDKEAILKAFLEKLGK